ncbi:MAG: hypothetical protein MJ089_03340 [Ruminococcus sp.]|nr:hypothetical protein [Ruminococcus sp.]
MKKIIEKEKYQNENQLIKNQVLKAGGELVNQDFIHKGIPSKTITFLIFVIMFIVGFSRINDIYTEKPETDLLFALKFITVFSIAFLLFPYIHEFCDDLRRKAVFFQKIM